MGMKHSEYLRSLKRAFDLGMISEEAYDLGIQNADTLAEDEMEENLTSDK